ncbi:prolipoprotein diacylglyceryl transferase [Aureimonas phyllosphaerae]|uniref:Phosphatidylglycerol--prolipoprotein diacylglyceryl transferase n=1 Tax=Aureimonas phyllosphaerae TaxID=1166078 RepID=A0A7W6BPS2_9HYPH|nr:prolipoprotein diacylglyceryl transferase [Aureimonas phyllosphaerae]MBB3935798.1 phosphatidylglycerol:prolipoprotein diacylglycerol transferase [Aureimonas phyllosphaerae]MBB3959806.1 phosphatidylglycerol:prolipoprotein diacylglycerol transferase [Aureimonas phyllosphaerae]SFF15230.1 Prolipoprotein diacylglyceryl transferase [Aureimonas phyllosphaerae]
MTASAVLGVLTYPQIDPVFLQIGPIALRWYGLAYVAGILCGWLYGRHLVGTSRLWPNGVSPITKTDIDDFIVWITIGIVAGGRFGSILFYDFDRVAADPLSAFRIWEGGMSFHGGLIGVTIAMILFCRSHKVPLFSLIDVVAASVPFGLFFGRIANFINGELWGAPTSVPWAMVFPHAGPEPRHPSQLYEAALEGIVLFLILRVLTHRFGALGRPRLVGGVFILLYGCARIFVEFFRMPDVQLGYLLGTGWLTMGMVLSLPMLLVGLWAIATAKPRAYEPRPAETTAAA